MADKKNKSIELIKSAKSIQGLKAVVDKVEQKDRDKAFVIAVHEKTDEIINRNI